MSIRAIFRGGPANGKVIVFAVPPPYVHEVPVFDGPRVALGDYPITSSFRRALYEHVENKILWKREYAVYKFRRYT